ncbi:MAG: hypothetical protein FWH12_08765 [Treponema sp.]|nr:hypothetical protein [Treponema sp.]
MDEKVKESIHQAYDYLKNREAHLALGLLRGALEIDFEHPELLYALKCLNWWLTKLDRLDDFHGSYEKGGYILSLWKPYDSFLALIGEDMGSLTEESVEACQYALKRFVFSRALDCFQDLLADETNQQDPALLLQAGRCCKGAGDWVESLRYLEQAGRMKREDSAILSELADVYALLGEDRSAKVLFREAFFIDPQGIDLRTMESEMIQTLRDRAQEKGYRGAELPEWIPVWACIWGIFSIKRELKPVELGRLKQSISSLENELGSPERSADRHQIIKPRLLNRYFWLIDHYEHSRETSPVQGENLIEQTLMRIKVVDPVVFEQYRT